METILHRVVRIASPRKGASVSRALGVRSGALQRSLLVGLLLSVGIPVSGTGAAAGSSRAEYGAPLAEITAKAPAGAPETGSSADTCVVFYFHRTLRCQTCLGMEAAARESVYENFLPQVGDRMVVWRAVDFDLPENTHFAEEFDLEGSSLVFAATARGKTVRWEKMEGLWTHAHEPEQLKNFVASELRRFLASATVPGEGVAEPEGDSPGRPDDAERTKL